MPNKHEPEIKHEPDIPAGLEAFVTRLDDLKIVFGAAAVPTLAAVKDGILHAMAARDRGDMSAAFSGLGEAMEKLARFADTLDPREGMAMRAVVQMFGGALRRGDEAEAKRTAAVMLESSGARQRKPQ